MKERDPVWMTFLTSDQWVHVSRKHYAAFYSDKWNPENAFYDWFYTRVAQNKVLGSSHTLIRKSWNALLLQSHITFVYLQSNTEHNGFSSTSSQLALRAHSDYCKASGFIITTESLGFGLTKQVNDSLLRVQELSLLLGRYYFLYLINII